MKQHARPAKHAQRKPWKEAHQMALTCGIFVALVALGIAAVGFYDSRHPSQAQSPATTQGKKP